MDERDKEGKVKGKIRVVDNYFSILTTGPLAGRPGFFIVLGKKGKKIKLAKLLQKVQNESASRFIIIKGENTLNTPLVDMFIRAGYYMQINTDGRQESPTDFPYVPKTVFTVVDVCTKEISPDLKKYAFAYKYKISTTTGLYKDGLPVGLYKPDNKTQIMLEPSMDGDVRANTTIVVETCKNFGYYMTFPYNNYIGLR